MTETRQGCPKILIVMTTPYNNGGSSRTLDSYFHFWESDSVAQIYTRSCEPTKGHCATFFQITDERLVARWLGRKIKTGKVYKESDLGDSEVLEDEYSGSASKLGYSLGAKHTPTIELLRGLLWRKRFWCTPELIDWLDDYQPECVLYNFSNHLFSQEIALFVAERFNIPVIPVIGDDYYFNKKWSLSPAYHLFRSRFRKLTERVMAHSKSAVYCSEKCMAKYGEYFGLGGAPIYISSTLKRREFKPISTTAPHFLYCGALTLGRNLALVEIADALCSIDSSWKLDVYAPDMDRSLIEPLESHPSIHFGGRVSYAQVTKRIEQCDVFVIAEGFRDCDLLFTRYSLSTKAADGLASGAAILTYGPCDAGVVEYMKSTGASTVCSRQDELIATIRNLVTNEEIQRQQYEKAVEVTNAKHTLESSSRTFQDIVDETLTLSQQGGRR